MADVAELPELDRSAAARHFLSMAGHLTSLAHLYDPNAKLAKGRRGNDPDKPRVKRAPSKYNMWMANRMTTFKNEARATAQCTPRARARGRGFYSLCLKRATCFGYPWRC
jgi:hypothetical protein